MKYHVAKKLVFNKVRKALGLDRCTKCYTGAAPITKDTLEFFLSLNIPVYELYGMSESSGPHTISLPDAFRITRYLLKTFVHFLAFQTILTCKGRNKITLLFTLGKFEFLDLLESMTS